MTLPIRRRSKVRPLPRRDLPSGQRQILLKPIGATKSDWLLGLLVGLLILTVGGFIRTLADWSTWVCLLGLGALAWQLYRVSRPAITT